MFKDNHSSDFHHFSRYVFLVLYLSLCIFPILHRSFGALFMSVCVYNLCPLHGLTILNTYVVFRINDEGLDNLWYSRYHDLHV